MHRLHPLSGQSSFFFTKWKAKSNILHIGKSYLNTFHFGVMKKLVCYHSNFRMSVCMCVRIASLQTLPLKGLLAWPGTSLMCIINLRFMSCLLFHSGDNQNVLDLFDNVLHSDASKSLGPCCFRLQRTEPLFMK